MQLLRNLIELQAKNSLYKVNNFVLFCFFLKQAKTVLIQFK